MKARFPSQAATLFLALPAVMLMNSLLVLRITPALLEGVARFAWIGKPINSLDDPYAWVLIGIALLALLATATITTLRARRLESDFAPLWGLLACVPILGIGVVLWLGSLRNQDGETEGSKAWQLAGRLAVPAIFCWVMVILLTVLGESLLHQRGYDRGYLSFSVLIVVPLTTAIVAGFVSGRAGGTYGQSVGAAFFTLMAVLTCLGFAAMEGVVCVVMAIPVVGVLALIGALIGNWLAQLITRPAGQVQSAAWLLVLLVAGGEVITPPAPLEDTVSSVVVIDATPAQVWAQLKDIRGLSKPTEPLFVLGVAHPLEAYVVGEGRVGAQRICRLSTGDMPELISVWNPGKELKFTVLDTPPAMREATFFGRDLDAPHLHSTYASLDGGFRLEALPDGRTRLIGTSRYALTIAPSTYWNLWTRAIVAQVQLRVMNHVKAQAEASAAR